MKMSLSSCVVDAKEDVERLFSSDNLRQLFQKMRIRYVKHTKHTIVNVVMLRVNN